MDNDRLAMILVFVVILAIITGLSACDYRSKSSEMDQYMRKTQFELEMAGKGFCKPFNSTEYRPCGDLMKGTR